MKNLGWIVVLAGILLQYLLIWNLLPVKGSTLLGLPTGVFGLLAGLVITWLGYIVLYQGWLGKRSAELDEELRQLEERRQSAGPDVGSQP